LRKDEHSEIDAKLLHGNVFTYCAKRCVERVKKCLEKFRT
jgi:hypothetical protein